MISLVMPTFRPRLMFLSNGYDWERLVDLGLTTSICRNCQAPWARARSHIGSAFPGSGFADRFLGDVMACT